jgi:YVTN family beta-propeller protein
MKTKYPLPKRFSGILIALMLALALATTSAAVAAPFAYVSNFGSNTVSVVDGKNNSVVVTMTVGKSPFGLAVNAAGTRAYVANYTDGSVSVIDTTSNTVLTSVLVGASPSGVAVSGDDTKVYVANGGGTVAVIDTTSNALVNTIVTGGALNAIAVTGSLVYVTDIASGRVVEINTSNANTQRSVPVGISPFSSPMGIAVSPTGARAYVANISDDLGVSVLAVSVIDTATMKVIVSVPIDTDSMSPPAGIALSPDGALVYVANQSKDTVTFISTLTNTVARNVALPRGSGPFGVAPDSTGTRVFVGNAGAANVSVIDTTTNPPSVGAPVAVGSVPLAFGAFVTAGPPPPTSPSCDDRIAALQKKAASLKHESGDARLQAVLRLRAAALQELALAKKKVGDRDRQVLRARKEFRNGDAALCAGHYWRAKHEFWEAYEIAHRILRHYHRH